MCAILELVSAPSNPRPIVDHFRRSHPLCEHSNWTAHERKTELKTVKWNCVWRHKTKQWCYLAYFVPIAQMQAGVAMSLGSLHYDELLDYGPSLPDKTAGAIVQKHYEHMNKVIKPLLDRRNNKRFQEGHLAYPFLTPGWIPNSICT